MKGTPSRNAEPHQKCWSRRPPTSGPIAMPPMKQLNQMPMAVIIDFSSVKMRADQAHRRGHERGAGDAEDGPPEDQLSR